MTVMDIYRVSDSFIRPNNTTAYAANDGVSDDATTPSPLTFSECSVREGRGGYIQAAKIITSAYTAAGDPGSLAGEVWLFDTAPTPAGYNDNAATAITDAELLNLVGVIEFDLDNGYPGTPTAGTGGNLVLHIDDLQLPFKCAIDDTDLYGIIIARNAYVPIAVEVFTVELFIDREMAGQ